VKDGAPGIQFGVQVPRTDRAKPREFFGYFAGLGIDSGVLKDLAVVDFIFGILVLFES
jgi:hypothetical protein